MEDSSVESKLVKTWEEEEEQQKKENDRKHLATLKADMQSSDRAITDHLTDTEGNSLQVVDKNGVKVLQWTWDNSGKYLNLDSGMYEDAAVADKRLAENKSKDDEGIKNVKNGESYRSDDGYTYMRTDYVDGRPSTLTRRKEWTEEVVSTDGGKNWENKEKYETRVAYELNSKKEGTKEYKESLNNLASTAETGSVGDGIQKFEWLGWNIRVDWQNILRDEGQNVEKWDSKKNGGEWVIFTGTWSMKMNNGDTYTGAIKDGKAEGNGTMIFTWKYDWWSFTGSFEKGNYITWTLKSPSEDQIWTFKDNKLAWTWEIKRKDGTYEKWEFKWWILIKGEKKKDGRIYTGEFSDAWIIKTGWKVKFENWNTYTGEFDIQWGVSGKGALLGQDGVRYLWNFKNAKLEGISTKIEKSGRKIVLNYANNLEKDWIRTVTPQWNNGSITDTWKNNGWENGSKIKTFLDTYWNWTQFELTWKNGEYGDIKLKDFAEDHDEWGNEVSRAAENIKPFVDDLIAKNSNLGEKTLKEVVAMLYPS